MPSITPAQRVFGIGVQPLEKMFRPPAGMEYDPAYNDFGRRTWAQEDLKDAQREEVLATTEKNRAEREQLKADRATRVAEDAAFAEMKKRPDEIPNILRSFPELARSKNFDNVLQYTQAVQPNAAQKTLSASLRSRLKPHELRYYDQHFGTHGDALAASDFAKLQGEHENGLVDMMKSGVPLDVIDKYRDRPLSPLERETLIQQHTKKPVNDLSPLMKSGMEELMKLEAAGDHAGAARLNNFLVNQGLHINKAAKIIPVPEEEDALTTPGSTTSTGKRGKKTDPIFAEYRKLYQDALEREAKAREEAAKEDAFPLKDANGNVIPPKAPPQPHELESSKIVQKALQDLNYDPRSNTLIPAIQEPIAGANPQAFAQSALSVANSGNRIVSPVDYSAVEMTPYASVNAPEFSGLPEQRFNASGVPQTQSEPSPASREPVPQPPNLKEIAKQTDFYALRNLATQSNASIEARKAAVDRLEAIKPPSNLPYEEARDLQKSAIEEARAQIDEDEAMSHLTKAKDKAKADLTKKVEAFAKMHNIPLENMWQNIATSTPFRASTFGIQRPRGESPLVAVEDLILAGKATEPHPILASAENAYNVRKWKRAPVAETLKTVGTLGTNLLNTANVDLLKELAQEKTKPVAIAAPAASVAPNAIKTSTGNTATLKSSN